MIRKLRRLRWIITGRLRIRRNIAQAAARGKVQVVLGASIYDFDGWISTDLPHFNILNEKHWRYLFGQSRADRLLAEHVMEHIAPDDVKKAVAFAYHYLKPGGVLRIAVPDANHPNPRYQELTLPPSDGHLSSWNFETLSAVLETAGFRVVLYEYYSAQGELILNPFENSGGPVQRSFQRGFVSPRLEGYSSLIVDAIKP